MREKTYANSVLRTTRKSVYNSDSTDTKMWTDSNKNYYGSYFTPPMIKGSASNKNYGYNSISVKANPGASSYGSYRYNSYSRPSY